MGKNKNKNLSKSLQNNIYTTRSARWILKNILFLKELCFFPFLSFIFSIKGQCHEIFDSFLVKPKTVNTKYYRNLHSFRFSQYRIILLAQQPYLPVPLISLSAAIYLSLAAEYLSISYLYCYIYCMYILYYIYSIYSCCNAL